MKKELKPEQAKQLLEVLKNRFEKNMHLHKKLDWNKIQSKLQKNPHILWALNEMEKTGGEPDVVGYDEKTDEYIFYDCAPETPKGRLSTCYDGEGQKVREKQGIHPNGNAIDIAAEMGIELLSEEEYGNLQKLGEFDLKTSSWVKTPSDIRKLGGALFCDRRFGHVFVYHNTAASFYSSRGFRGVLKV